MNESLTKETMKIKGTKMNFNGHVLEACQQTTHH